MPEPITKSEIIGCFKANLVSLLKNNSSGTDDSRYWLVRNELGDVAIELEPPAEVEEIGGVPVPPCVVQDDKIFRPKQQNVIDFLMSFSLSRPDAQDIVDSIGMNPSVMDLR